MKGNYLGELEELVLLTVGVLYPEAYGVGVMDEL
ncbi:MAG: PadR family transcriptional regulator, partial [Cytophagia bacterium]|nr:PadR family transcriptional regulator [Cytophagia bacterium]